MADVRDGRYINADVERLTDASNQFSAFIKLLREVGICHYAESTFEVEMKKIAMEIIRLKNKNIYK